MRIIDVQIGKIKVPLKRPFKTALRTAYVIEDIVIKIFSDNGLVGYGSCAHTPLITGETHGSLIDALLILKEKILHVEFHSLEKILNTLSTSFVHNTSALSCFDIALHDIYCQFLKLPLYQYLGGDHNIVFSDMTISCNDITVMIADALCAIDDGFHELKIKVGLDPANDFERIFAISKAVGPKIKLRIDANQGWKPKEALRIINQLERHNLNIEFIEQPVHANDLEGLAFIRNNVCTDILADESIFSPQDALKIVQTKSSDLLNIKLAKAGGLLPATKIYHVAQAAFIECIVGCMLESPIAVSAAVHFAAAKKYITRCDLDPPFLIAQNPVECSVSVDGNALIIDEKVSGLGIKHVHDFKFIV
ncbi:MAG: dipeptide epimerase [Bdellovibrionota bacterium]